MTPLAGLAPDLALVGERVRAELGDLLDVLDRVGGPYADRYAKHLTSSRSDRRAPACPPELPPIAATVVKELVLDELASHRRQGGAARRMGGMR